MPAANTGPTPACPAGGCGGGAGDSGGLGARRVPALSATRNALIFIAIFACQASANGQLVVCLAVVEVGKQHVEFLPGDGFHHVTRHVHAARLDGFCANLGAGAY